MTAEDEKREYLDEHLPYSLKMLKYTYDELFKQHYYLDWNAYFESFAVHARNIVNFLTNNDSGNMQAKEFGSHRSRIGEVSGAMSRLRAQVFHLAKERPRQLPGKFDTENATTVYEWIEKNFSEFLAYLQGTTYEGAYNTDKADRTKDGVPTLSRQSASSAAPVMTIVKFQSK